MQRFKKTLPKVSPTIDFISMKRPWFHAESLELIEMSFYLKITNDEAMGGLGSMIVDLQRQELLTEIALRN